MAPDKGKARAPQSPRGSMSSTAGPALSHGRAGLLPDSDDETLPAPNERTRLLSSTNADPEAGGSPASARSQRISARLRSSPTASLSGLSSPRNIRWFRVALVVIICLVGAAVLALAIAYTVISSRFDDAEAMARRGLRWRAPDHVAVEHVSDDGREMRIRVDMRAGIDSRAALDDETLPAWLVKWATRRVGAVHCGLDGQVDVDDRRRNTLVSVPGSEIPAISLPLNFGSLEPLDWLAPLSIPITIRAVAPPKSLLDYANASYIAGQASARVKVSGASAKIRLFGVSVPFNVDELDRTLSFALPKLDGLGRPSDLIHLNHYAVRPDDDTMRIFANATVTNPIANSTLLDQLHVPRSIVQLLLRTPVRLPWPMRFEVALPALNRKLRPLTVAAVDMQPFKLVSVLAHSVNVTMNGTAIPPPSDDETPGTDSQLSRFLGAWLDGRDSTVQVSYRGQTGSMPSFVDDLLRSIPPISATFPGLPEHEPLLADVTIAHMRVGTTRDGDKLACSGTVRGRLNLPKALKSVSSALQIDRVFPDVLVFDGAPGMGGRAPKKWPPALYPPRAFARLKPSDWLPARTVAEKGQTWVEANMTDVALDVLEGRGPQFRQYARRCSLRECEADPVLQLAKILLGSGGIETGVWGVSAVRGGVEGFGATKLELDHLPVEGVFMVDRGGLGSLTDLL